MRWNKNKILIYNICSAFNYHFDVKKIFDKIVLEISNYPKILEIDFIF